MLGPTDDIVAVDEAAGIDFEGEVAVITGDVRHRRRRRPRPRKCIDW